MPEQPPPPADLPPRNQLPHHVAIIMDGNGRWARSRGLPRIAGHRRGADAVRTITRASRRWGLRALTLYAFSEQNWARPQEEVEALMDLLREYIVSERAEILDNNIRLTTIGNLMRLPQRVADPLAELIHDSRGNQGMTLCLALSYGGREEIVRAARRIADQVSSGRLRADDVTEDLVSSCLWTTEAGLPDPDLIIRTSGETRLSNFLPWQSTYAELFFTPQRWPDFDESSLVVALRTYAQRQRRFGRTDDQLASDPGE